VTMELEFEEMLATGNIRLLVDATTEDDQELIPQLVHLLLADEDGGEEALRTLRMLYATGELILGPEGDHEAPTAA
jgi:hypothetical protein